MVGALVFQEEGRRGDPTSPTEYEGRLLKTDLQLTINDQGGES